MFAGLLGWSVLWLLLPCREQAGDAYHLRGYVEEDAAEPCEYGCGCPNFNDLHVPGKGPHGRCRSCMARESLRLADTAPPAAVMAEAERIVNKWNRIEGEYVREGHRATMERLIAAALQAREQERDQAVKERTDRQMRAEKWAGRAGDAQDPAKFEELYLAALKDAGGQP